MIVLCKIMHQSEMIAIYSTETRLKKMFKPVSNDFGGIQFDGLPWIHWRLNIYFNCDGN